MEFLRAAVLGVVQGVAEFLPISSDGHLILVPSLLGWGRFGLGFDVMLHAGTLLATVLYFRKDFADLVGALVRKDPAHAPSRRLAWLLVIATVPSVFVVLALESFVEGVESRPIAQQIAISAWGLLGTATLLALSEIIANRHKHQPNFAEQKESESLGWGRAVLIGVAQGFAALPGVSRSGSTIAAGLALGVNRGEAARFSFLMSVPIIAAATAKKSLDLLQGEGSLPSLGVTLVGVGVTALVGYAVIGWLLPFIRKHSLWWFVAYTAIAGILLLVLYGNAL